VGDAKRRGISGGERKRLSIGCELIGSPNLLFLDEPTSGLDAYQAQQVVALLKQLALEGTAVVAVIHQPRGTSFKMFDDLLLLSEGQLMFSGEAARAAAHFGRLGHRCPSGIAEAEHVVDLVSADYSSPDALAASLARIAGFATTAAQPATTASVVARAAAPSAAAPAPAAAGTPGFKTKVPAAARPKRQVAPRRANVLTQFALLFGRAWREVARSKAALIIKATQQACWDPAGRRRPNCRDAAARVTAVPPRAQVMISLIYGGIYSLGNTQSSIQDRFGLLSLVAIGAGNLAIASTIRTFPKEKTIVQADRAKQLYGVGPYFLSKVRVRVRLRVRVRVRAQTLILTLTLTRTLTLTLALTLTLTLLPEQGRGGGATLRTALGDGRRPALPARRPAVGRRGSNCTHRTHTAHTRHTHRTHTAHTPHTHRTRAAARCGALRRAAARCGPSARGCRLVAARPRRRPHAGPARTPALPP